VSRLFAPSLEALAASIARRPLVDLWSEPAELARVTLEAARRAEAGAVLFPFDVLLLAESAGGSVAWRDAVPHLAEPGAARLENLEPADMLERCRIPAAVEATRFMATHLPVAAHVPSPSLVVEQFLGGSGNEDQMASAEDLAAGLARVLLEARASALVVRTGQDDPLEKSALRRLADHFGASFMLAGSGRLGPPVVPVSVMGDPPAMERAVASLQPGPIVLTDGPVPGDIDLTRLASLAAQVASSELTTC
jgi:hypothetical protein